MSALRPPPGQPDLALVTGTARGIGAAIAAHLADAGWRVVRADSAWPEGCGMAADRLTLDVTDYPAVCAAVAAVEQSFGPLGALVNNAGITRDAMAHRMDPASHWAPVIAVNLTGPFNLCRAVVPGLRERGFGRIVNMASMNGLRGQAGQANYSAAKAGLIGLTRTLALELAGRGVTVNCIAPGFIDTEMTRALRPDLRQAEIARIPAGRPGRTDEVAALATYLCSDLAGFITGETVSINGGQLMG